MFIQAYAQPPHALHLSVDRDSFELIQDCLTYWTAQGYVEQVLTTPETQLWRLTESGLQVMHARNTMNTPERVLTCRGVRILDMTIWELYITLGEQGWTHMALEADAEEPQAFIGNHDISPRIWYTRISAKALNRDYMISLCEANALADKGIRRIAHFQSATLYASFVKVLLGKTSKLAIQFESDQNDADADALEPGLAPPALDDACDADVDNVDDLLTAFQEDENDVDVAQAKAAVDKEDLAAFITLIDPDGQDDVQPPPPKKAKFTKVKRRVFHFGPFRLGETKRRGNLWSFEITCPYHTVRNQPRCCKEHPFNPDASDMDDAIARLKLWAVEGLDMPIGSAGLKEHMA